MTEFSQQQQQQTNFEQQKNLEMGCTSCCDSIERTQKV